MRVADLLQDIPADTDEVVAKACSSWSRRVRAQLSEQLLRWNLRHPDQWEPREAHIVNDWKSVGRPLPRRLEELRVPPGLERAARLSVYAPAAKRLAESAQRLAPLFGSDVGPLFDAPEADDWSDSPLSPSDARTTLQDAKALGELLQRMAMPELDVGDSFDLVRFLLEVDEDVLGLYQMKPDEDGPGLRANPRGHVHVFWGAVGLVAAALGVPVRALSVVVLAHELAHAYLHLGHDRDGRRWASQDFAESDVHLHEALAQYYTHLVCERLDRSLPGLFEAYWTLLPKQPQVYQLHLPLILKSSPEQVASAMAELRTGPAYYFQLIERLGVEGAMNQSAAEWRHRVEVERLPKVLGAWSVSGW